MLASVMKEACLPLLFCEYHPCLSISDIAAIRSDIYLLGRRQWPGSGLPRFIRVLARRQFHSLVTFRDHARVKVSYPRRRICVLYRVGPSQQSNCQLSTRASIYSNFLGRFCLAVSNILFVLRIRYVVFNKRLLIDAAYNHQATKGQRQEFLQNVLHCFLLNLASDSTQSYSTLI